MTAKKTPDTVPEKPKFLVVDSVLYAQTAQGELKFPLSIKTKVIRSIREAGVDQMDQFFLILDSLGDKATIARVDELDFMDTAEIIAKFFAEFEEIQKARTDLFSGQPTS